MEIRKGKLSLEKMLQEILINNFVKKEEKEKTRFISQYSLMNTESSFSNLSIYFQTFSKFKMRWNIYVFEKRGDNRVNAPK